ncbi:MAG: ChaN family lipoprotein [Bacteroidales bacterium]|nr:ChaN family lipoprotein [Bacteroidales bacterium]
MKARLFILSLVVLIAAGFRSDKPAYRIYDTKGKTVKYKKLVKEALDADVVFFGELHNNPISHWLQFELTKSLEAGKDTSLILGAEMFEADNGLILQEYISGKIPAKNFNKEAKLWPNYNTDYKPLVDFAKDSNLRFIATNVPRRYAALVNKKGFEGLDTLSKEAYDYIAPLPIKFDPEIPGYKKMSQMMKNMGHGSSGHIVKAQALKDATMAHFILKNYKPGKLFLHFNGAFHSKNHEGIVWYIKEKNPTLKVLTISTVQQDNIEELKEDSHGTADYIIAVPSSMTKTH